MHVDNAIDAARETPAPLPWPHGQGTLRCNAFTFLAPESAARGRLAARANEDKRDGLSATNVHTFVVAVLRP
jgi:hypothetical protein